MISYIASVVASPRVLSPAFFFTAREMREDLLPVVEHLLRRVPAIVIMF